MTALLTPSFRSSFQFRLFLSFSLLTLLLVLPLTIFHIYDDINDQLHFANEMLQMQAERLTDSIRLPLYAENLGLLDNLAQQALTVPEMISVVITAPDGRVLVDRHRQDSGSSSGRVISKQIEVGAPSHIGSVESLMTGGRDSSASMIGTIRMVRGTNDLAHRAVNQAATSVAITIFCWLAISLFAHLLLKRTTRSFGLLMSGIETLRGGNLDCRIATESDDESGSAATAINNLAETLQLRNEENRLLLEERLDYERKMLESQKLESLGIMAGGIAHDFNNLLQAILGNVEMAERELAPESSTRRHISNAMKAAWKAANLTNMMLAYAGMGLIVKKAISLNDLVRDNADILEGVISANVSIELHLFSELPSITADEAQLQQLIMNLITNAAESIENSHGFVRITTGILICDQDFLAASMLAEKPEPGRFAFLEVKDNGCGMSKETVRRIFEPFFTTKFTGRGLGMSAVMGIMKSHNGAMFVESAPGSGTTFRMLFPVQDLPHPHPNLEGEGTKSLKLALMPDIPEAPLSGMVMVVDDEKAVLRTCAKMVSLCGFKVITAVDGVDAVAKFREHADEIAVVLLDLTMPNMDGIAAMGEIYSIRPDVKIILASGFNEEELGKRLGSQSPDGFMRKPYSMSVLETELKRFLPAV